MRLVDVGESTTDTDTDMSSPKGSIVCKTSLDEIQVFNQYASNVIEVNGVPIGKTTIPSELVKVRYKDRDHFIQVFYD